VLLDTHYRIEHNHRTSNRSFGFFISWATLLLMIYFSDYSYIQILRSFSFFTAFVLITLFLPNLFQPLNFVWGKLGYFLSYLITPIVLGIIYLITIIPMGLYIKLRKNDPMGIRFDRDKPTYWNLRAGTGDKVQTDLYNQF
jgi:hypothetical protein